MMTILATVDDSSASHEVLPVVRKLAKSMGARVILLTVRESAEATPRRRPAGPVGPITAVGLTGTGLIGAEVQAPAPGWAETRDQAVERAAAEGRDLLAALAEPIEKEGIKVEKQVVIAEDPVAVIIDAARRENVDLIAMATHGRSALASVIQGSVAAAVLRSGVAPTLLVRPKALKG